MVTQKTNNILHAKASELGLPSTSWPFRIEVKGHTYTRNSTIRQFTGNVDADDGYVYSRTNENGERVYLYVFTEER